MRDGGREGSAVEIEEGREGVWGECGMVGRWIIFF